VPFLALAAELLPIFRSRRYAIAACQQKPVLVAGAAQERALEADYLRRLPLAAAVAQELSSVAACQPAYGDPSLSSVAPGNSRNGTL
jgi:hypothetical protein